VKGLLLAPTMMYTIMKKGRVRNAHITHPTNQNPSTKSYLLTATTTEKMHTAITPQRMKYQEGTATLTDTPQAQSTVVSTTVHTINNAWVRGYR